MKQNMNAPAFHYVLPIQQQLNNNLCCRIGLGYGACVLCKGFLHECRWISAQGWLYQEPHVANY